MFYQWLTNFHFVLKMDWNYTNLSNKNVFTHNLNNERIVWFGQMQLVYTWTWPLLKWESILLPKMGCNAKRKEYKFQTWVGNLKIIATSAWKYPIECVLYQTLKCKVNFGPITVSGTKFTRSRFQKSTKELRHIKTIYS